MKSDTNSSGNSLDVPAYTRVRLPQPYAVTSDAAAVPPKDRNSNGASSAPAALSPAAPASIARAGGQMSFDEVLAQSIERRARLRDRIQASSKPVAAAPSLPSTPAETKDSALQLIQGLRQALASAREENSALKRELEEARMGRAQAVAEAGYHKSDAQRLADEVASRAQLVREIGDEMKSLEAERDELLNALNDARQTLIEAHAACLDLERRAAAAEAMQQRAAAARDAAERELHAQADALGEAERALKLAAEEREAMAARVAELEKVIRDGQQTQAAFEQLRFALAKNAQ